MKKNFLFVSLLATAIFLIPVKTWSRIPVTQKSFSAAIPRNVLETANDWMYAHALPYTRIRPTYTNLGKGIWEIRWTWQVATGAIYDATLVIHSSGRLINEPIIDMLESWPF